MCVLVSTKSLILAFRKKVSMRYYRLIDNPNKAKASRVCFFIHLFLVLDVGPRFWGGWIALMNDPTLLVMHWSWGRLTNKERGGKLN